MDLSFHLSSSSKIFWISLPSSSKIFYKKCYSKYFWNLFHSNTFIIGNIFGSSIHLLQKYFTKVTILNIFNTFIIWKYFWIFHPISSIFFKNIFGSSIHLLQKYFTKVIILNIFEILFYSNTFKNIFDLPYISSIFHSKIFYKNYNNKYFWISLPSSSKIFYKSYNIKYFWNFILF